MNRKIFSLLSAAALVLALGSMAKADTCESLSNTGVSATVCYTVTGNTITTTSISVDGGLGTVKSIDEVGFVNNVTLTSTTSNGTWKNVTASPSAGFSPDTWNYQVFGSKDPTNGGLASWTFSGVPGSTDFLFHIQYTVGNTGCSTWVANGDDHTVSSTASSEAGCGGSTVPEPGSLALFGTGILGMAGYLRRRFLA